MSNKAGQYITDKYDIDSDWKRVNSILSLDGGCAWGKCAYSVQKQGKNKISIETTRSNETTSNNYLTTDTTGHLSFTASNIGNNEILFVNPIGHSGLALISIHNKYLTTSNTKQARTVKLVSQNKNVPEIWKVKCHDQHG